MRELLRFEELAMFGASIALFALLDVGWWIYPTFLLAPDVGMLGYLIGPRFGANTYNLLHHKGVAVFVGLTGLLAGATPVIVVGLILFGHASMDRIFGYGLKMPDDFRHTHLGWLGKQRQ